MNCLKSEWIAAMAVILLLSVFLLPAYATGLLGFLFVSLSAVDFTIRGGLFSAFWASFVLVLSYYVPGSSLAVMELIAIVVTYFLTSLSLGRVILLKKKQGQIDDTNFKAREKLQRTIQYYENLFDSIHDPIFVVNKDMVLVSINKQMNEEFRDLVQTHQLIGKPLSVLTPFLSTSSRDEYAGIFETGTSVVKEEKIVRKGQLYYRETTKWPVINEKGNVAYIITVMRDTTERKRADENMPGQRERLHDILAGTLVGTWEWNVQTGEITFNERLAEIIGYTLPGLVPISICKWEKMIHPEDLDLHNKKIDMLFKGETTHYSMKCRMKHNKGHWVWLFHRGKVISWTHASKPLWIFGTSLDITEEVETERALQESELKYRLLFEKSELAIMIVDEEGYYTDANETALNFLEITKREDLFKKQVFDFTPPGVLEKQKKEHAPFFESRTLETDYLIHGKIKTLLLKVIPMKINHKNLLYGIGQDISDRKEKEKETKEAHQRLLKVLNNIDSLIYVADMETYEILFINHYGQKLWGDIVGKKCWETLQQGQKGPCDFCTNDKLVDAAGVSTGVFKWEFKNTITKEWYMCHDSVLYWIDGRLARMEIATDVTDRKQLEESLEYQHKFQRIVASISYSFINTPRMWIDEAIQNTLINIGEFFQVDRAHLFQFSPDDLYISKTHEWCREGIEPQKERITEEPVNDMPWIISQIRSKKYVFISDVSKIRYENEKREFQRQGIQSLVSIPIRVNDKITGFLGMESVRKKMRWTEEEIILLTVIVEIISSAFTKHEIEGELHVRTQELQKEIEKATEIHRQVLPKTLPVIENITFAAHYQPASRLGGDFYDFIQVHNKLVFYLSDVSGHGLDSAMLNFFVKHTIKGFLSFALSNEVTPVNILCYLAQQFQQENYPEEYLISLFLNVLDLETMEITYSGAGFQDTPFVKMGNEEQLQLRSKGLFLSPLFSPGENYFKDNQLSLTPGTTIFFNTDGLTEQGEAGNFYKNRLPAVFYENAHLPPQDIVQAVVEDYRAFNKGVLQGQDDITFLVLQVHFPENRPNNDCRRRID